MRVAVTFTVRPRERGVLAEALGAGNPAAYLTDLDDAGRSEALRGAQAMLARNTEKELLAHEKAMLGHLRLIQFMTAGVDFVKLGALPPEVPVASNGGAYAEPMAEHALAMILAAAKRLIPGHQALGRGAFNQFAANRMLAGMTCGILGFGGIGSAAAPLLQAFGVRVHAINRSGRTERPVDWIGTPADLDTMLTAADVLMLCLPLTPATRGLIGARELRLMKPDAILVNLARGEIVEEAALFAHLQAMPAFTACIDAWWVEPVRHGLFRMDHPFMTLPNVVGSPHNSASVAGVTETALRRAAANVRRALADEPPHHLVRAEERMR